jgi:hypothetical protein
MAKSNNILLLFFYGFIAMLLMAPLASDDYLPQGDYIAHTAGIIEAKNAIRHNQFPIRIAPHYGNSAFYPYFQFYSPLPYTVAGYIHKLVISNPFVVLKLVMWFALMLGGFYLFRLCHWLTDSKVASLLAGVVYLLSPYLIINATIRGDFTEATAQGLLPVALYYSLRLFKTYNLRFFLLSAIMWFAILTTHLITFAYGSLFFLLFLTIYICQDRKQLKNLLLVILSIGLGCMLALWYLAPILLYAHYVYQYGSTTGSPAQTNWLTPLSILLSLKSISPVPMPGKGQLIQPLHFSIGMPIVLSFGTILYALISDKNILHKKMIMTLTITFIIALFAIWSPFDFWIYLPKFFGVVQFSYRILSQLMWIGSILFAFMLVWLFKDKLDFRVGFILLAFIMIACSSWMYNSVAGSNDSIDRANGFYKDDPVSNNNYRIEPWRFSDKIIETVKAPIQNCIRGEGESKVCEVVIKKTNSTIALPILYFPQMLKIAVNGKPVNYFPLLYNATLMAGLHLESGKYQITAKFTGLVWANWLCILTWLIMFTCFFWMYLKNRRNLAKE